MINLIPIVLGFVGIGIIIVFAFITQSKVLSKMYEINQKRLDRISDKSFEESNREINSHIEIVNIKLRIQKEAEKKFERAMSKLDKKQQEKILKKKPIIVFPTRGDYLDWLRMEIESDFGIKYEGVKDDGGF